jgi:hypothetical protein
MTKSKNETPATAASSRLTPIPKEQLSEFKKAVTDKVVQPMKNRALQQRDSVARARARYVR